MNLVARLVDRLLRWLDWAPLPVSPPRPRRLRMTCLSCGKDLAVVRTTGAVWRHQCRPPALPDEAPGPHAQHDTWDEHKGRR